MSLAYFNHQRVHTLLIYRRNISVDKLLCLKGKVEGSKFSIVQTASVKEAQLA